MTIPNYTTGQNSTGQSAPALPTRSLLDTEQLALLLGVRSNTLAQWRMTGAGPTFVRIGRRVRYRPDDVDAWIDSQVRRSTSDSGRPT